MPNTHGRLQKWCPGVVFHALTGAILIPMQPQTARIAIATDHILVSLIQGKPIVRSK